MKLKGKRALVLVEDMYQEQELWHPLYRLQEEGVEVIVVGPAKGKEDTSKVGLPIQSDAAAHELNPGDYDAVIIPGGYAPDRMRRHPEMVELVAEAFRLNKVVAAICHGPWMLASAEVLQGRTVTSFFAIKDDLVDAGATYVDHEVMVDGNLITSRQPEDLPAFMRAVIESLQD